MRAFFAGLASVVLLFVAPAAAQTDLERAQTQTVWTQEIGQFNIESLDFLTLANRAVEIAYQYEDGEIDFETADAQLNAWRAEMDGELDRRSAEADRLAAGPALSMRGQEVMIEGMRGMSQQTVTTVRRYTDASEAFARGTLRGEAPDAFLLDAQRYAVMQDYYVGLRTANDAARLTVETNHPQHHLLIATVANLDNTILLFEIGRQAFGAAPSSYAVEDFNAAFAANEAVVTEAISDAQIRADQFARVIEQQLGDSAQGRVLAAMFGTYPESFEVELLAAAMFSQAPQRLAAPMSLDEWDAMIEELGGLETRRDEMLFERQRLISEMQ
jgi:hypothetical protein